MLQLCAIILLSFHFGRHCVTAKSLPVSVNFGTKFLGYDGLWSAAEIRVGTPEQYLSVYPSTVSSETWVIGPGGCGITDIDCQQARGGLFFPNQSSTYQNLGQFQLDPNTPGLATDFGDYALDSIAISDSVSTSSQVIAAVTDTDVWLGQLGLGVQEQRFTGQTDHFSFISTLAQNESVIPSRSFGYTAGAYYAKQSVPGSLILGGVDTTRFMSNAATFQLNTAYLPVATIKRVEVTSSQSQGLVALPPNWNQSPLVLMQESQAALFTIDSSTPFLWMPPDVCDAFAAALNLTYNTKLDLYVFPNATNSTSSSQTLADWGLTFAFTLTDSSNSQSQIELTISYNAFKLQLSFGFPGLDVAYQSPGVDYFPLRRANSSTQYTIGRAFLQETYLTVDYERGNFSLSQAVFPDTNAVSPQVIAIEKPDLDGKSLSGGAKAGIGVGVAVLVVAAIALIIVLCGQRRKVKHIGEKTPVKKKWTFRRSAGTSVVEDDPVAELSGDRRQPRELLVDSSNTRFELPGNAPIEMPAAEVPQTYFAANQDTDGAALNVLANTGTSERQLTAQPSIRKDYNIRAAVTERPASPAPPYSPSELDQNTSSSSEGVSSYGSRLSVGFGSHSTSSGAAVSPITQNGTRSTVEENRSSVSPVMRTSGTMSSARMTSTTRDSSQMAALVVPSNRISRTASHNSRFREELLEETNHDQQTQEQSQQLRARFSWEE